MLWSSYVINTLKMLTITRNVLNSRKSYQVLGSFAKLRKATVCCLVSVCPSVRPYEPLGTARYRSAPLDTARYRSAPLGPHRTDFHEI